MKPNSPLDRHLNRHLNSKPNSKPNSKLPNSKLPNSNRNWPFYGKVSSTRISAYTESILIIQGSDLTTRFTPYPSP